ncbi:unnamed protein product [Mytilus coruscus]|uniref:Uncharacterized protein n=1 Tax=Mytilus coruscus TaxID=42192 RepID=A0A6J8E5S1_MYTCO|nr:unnamed protein product [Mytilus coruscus]
MEEEELDYEPEEEQLGPVKEQRIREQTHGYKDEFLVDWVEMMNGLLIELSRQFKVSTLDKLVTFARDMSTLKQCSKASFHQTDLPFLQNFNKINHFHSSSAHTVFPPTYIYSLLHWKILALLIKSSEYSKNLLSYSCKMSLCKISSYPIHTVIDTHFHWDKFFLQARFSGLPSYIWEEQGNEKFQIRKLISNFVFPSRWRACLEGDLLSKDKRILHTIGIHPKIAGNQVGHHLKELKRRIPATTSDEEKEVDGISENASDTSEEDLKACRTCGLVFVHLRGLEDQKQRGCGINKSIKLPISERALNKMSRADCRSPLAVQTTHLHTRWTEPKRSWSIQTTVTKREVTELPLIFRHRVRTNFKIQ